MGNDRPPDTVQAVSVESMIPAAPAADEREVSFSSVCAVGPVGLTRARRIRTMPLPPTVSLWMWNCTSAAPVVACGFAPHMWVQVTGASLFVRMLP